ncbi:MAG: RidA family protein [Edaphobacter sp.]
MPQSNNSFWLLRSLGGVPVEYQDRSFDRLIVFTSQAAKPPATYSQAVKAAGLVFVSGTGHHDPETGTINGITIQEQTRQCLANIVAILVEAGSSLDRS